MVRKSVAEPSDTFAVSQMDYYCIVLAEENQGGDTPRCQGRFALHSRGQKNNLENNPTLTINTRYSHSYFSNLKHLADSLPTPNVSIQGSSTTPWKM